MVLCGTPSRYAQRRGKNLAWPPLPLPSEPDRCFVIAVDDYLARKYSQTVVQLREREQKAVRVVSRVMTEADSAETRVSAGWEPSSRRESGVAFLDLPREIRDLVYDEICGELKREGLRWDATAPRARTTSATTAMVESSTPYRRSDPVTRPAVFADCAAMRTCRQLHSEFASALYSSPLQLSGLGAGLNEVILSPVYAGLVRTVFAAYACLNEAGCDDTWLETLEIAAGLSTVFPNLDVRLGWFVTSYAEDPVTLTLRDPSAWDATTDAAEKSIRRVQRQTGIPLKIPNSLEVVQLEGLRKNGHSWPNEFSEVVSMPTPVTAAIRKLRSKQTQTLTRVLRSRKT
jgi:hypothetical protein